MRFASYFTDREERNGNGALNDAVLLIRINTLVRISIVSTSINLSITVCLRWLSTDRRRPFRFGGWVCCCFLLRLIAVALVVVVVVLVLERLPPDADEDGCERCRTIGLYCTREADRDVELQARCN